MCHWAKDLKTGKHVHFASHAEKEKFLKKQDEDLARAKRAEPASQQDQEIFKSILAGEPVLVTR